MGSYKDLQKYNDSKLHNVTKDSHLVFSQHPAPSFLFCMRIFKFLAIFTLFVAGSVSASPHPQACYNYNDCGSHGVPWQRGYDPNS